MDCLFCKIIQGELPCERIYEDKDILAFLDLYPINEGHVLIVTKEHFQGLLELPADKLSKLAIVMQRVASAVKEAYGLRGFNILLNDGRIGGQAIPHIHFHVIPRFYGDGVRVPSGHRPYIEGKIQQVREKIVEKLRA
ncbi:MAG: HIT family protein [Candidatus Tectomicrobia bacterium]|uniref:HIT family protein n=1 Tax=Tectimicrobiota bacterium TaxID=2528274 RepID=A0A933GNM0_UNCTE|nr:HIT family protein [Candidatus Tectomicrobia bacterium]